jgi:hypothetical protein
VTARMVGAALILAPNVEVNIEALAVSRPWTTAAKSVAGAADARDASWTLLRELVSEPSRSGSATGGVEGLREENWLRLVVSVWEVNELEVARNDPMAVASRPFLALVRFRSFMRAVEDGCGAEVLARLFGPRADADRGVATAAERRSCYLRVAAARAIWYDYLTGGNRDAVPIVVSDELATELVLRTSGGKRVRRDLGELVPGDGAERVDELTATQSMARRLLLPRFLLEEMHVLCGGHRRWSTLALPAAVVAAVATSVWSIWGWSENPGRLTNHLPAAVVLVAAIATLTSAKSISVLHTFDAWCLKIPSVTIIGCAAALALPPQWMAREGVTGKTLGAVACVGAVFVYLVIEASVHTAPQRASAGLPRPMGLVIEASAHSAPQPFGSIVWRATRVWLLGLGQAAVVTAAVLGSVGTVLITGDECARSTVDCPVPPTEVALRLPTFAFLVSVSLAVGVFLQSLWETEPITYPIAHLPRRGDVT